MNSFDGTEGYGEKNYAETILIPDDYDETNYEMYLKKIYKQIFEEQLESWMNAPDTWPKKRDYKQFNEWFQVVCSDMIWDYGDDPLEHEDL